SSWCDAKSTSAGFRTTVLLTLVSTIFSIVSGHGVGSDDRISANSITGIGFIGAGVIFKDQIAIRGLTTAAVIWTSAAIGMTTGIGYHALAFLFTIITLLLLLMVGKIEKVISKHQKQKIVTVTFRHPEFEQIVALEKQLNSDDLIIERLEVSKLNDSITVVWQVSGRKKFLVELDGTLANIPDVISFR